MRLTNFSDYALRVLMLAAARADRLITIEETAAAMGISVRTVNRHWTYARAWLYRQLEGPGE